MRSRFHPFSFHFLVSLTALVLSLPGSLLADSYREIGRYQAGGTGVTLTLHQSQDGSTIDFRIANSDTVTYNVVLNMELENMGSSKPIPMRTTVEPASSATSILTITRVNSGAPFYYRNFTWQLKMGPDPSRRVQHNGLYEYPWAPGATFRVDNGFNGYGAHTGAGAWAVDFKMQEGTPVHAARGGKVIGIESRHSQGGADPSFADKANFIFIQHGDGSVARYLHFRQGGVAVSINQQVEAGDLIGYSGNTGWSTDPHLHFDVTVPDEVVGLRTIPFQFQNENGEAFTPQTGMTLTKAVRTSPESLSQIHFACGMVGKGSGCNEKKIIGMLGQYGCKVEKSEILPGKKISKIDHRYRGDTLVIYSSNCSEASSSGCAPGDRERGIKTLVGKRAVHKKICISSR